VSGLPAKNHLPVRDTSWCVPVDLLFKSMLSEEALFKEESLFKAAQVLSSGISSVRLH
jgi:hypothetical protein